jgi:hypothetical protein
MIIKITKEQKVREDVYYNLERLMKGRIGGEVKISLLSACIDIEDNEAYAPNGKFFTYSVNPMIDIASQIKFVCKSMCPKEIINVFRVEIKYPEVEGDLEMKHFLDSLMGEGHRLQIQTKYCTPRGHECIDNVYHRPSVMMNQYVSYEYSVVVNSI